MANKRTAKLARKTKETDISIELGLDGSGKYKVDTTVPFLGHMLELMCKHGLLDAKIKARGDTHIDDHHTVEDVGLALGAALKQALGDMKGIRRYGFASVPMDETLAEVSIDISGRPYLVFNVCYPKKAKIKGFETDLVLHFLESLVAKSQVTLHVNVPYGRNVHHMVEAVFKALGRAIRDAVELDPRVKGVPSTKGKL